jgi:hypothetical protein
MTEDALTKFRQQNKSTPSGPTGRPVASSHPPAGPALPGQEAYEAYEAFGNEVRATTIELRCHDTGLAYFLPYAHMGAIIFDFRTGGQLYFTGAGYGVTIKGRGLRRIVTSMRLHACAMIQDHNPAVHALPQPEDPDATFVDSLEVETLRPGKPEKPSEEREVAGSMPKKTA